MLTQTTSGLEPIFQPFYIRRKKVNKGERVDFVDELGIEWQNFPVLHEQFKEWAETTQNIVSTESLTNERLKELSILSPWYGSTANDIDWKKRVELQGIIQRYITHSISSTINLPNDVTEEEVSEIYLHSWKMGLKGITVYRDGSRSGVLVSNDDKDKTSFDQNDAPKRPKELIGEIHTSKTKDIVYTVIIGLLDGKPYEVFIDTSEHNLNGKGTITKKSKGKYTFTQGEESFNISNCMTDEQEAITRLTSSSLRHGANIKFLVEQLNKIDGEMFSFTKSLARVLKKYIPDGEKSTVTCQDCGSDQVIFQEGCQSCQSCGSSKCG